MKERSLLPIGLTLLSVAMLCCAFVQRRELLSLRVEQRRLQQQTGAASSPAVNDAAPTAEVSTTQNPESAPASPSVSSELLKLRNQVSQLTRIRNELAPLAAENERLKSEIVGSSTNVNASGYIRQSQARFVGYDTPEHTLESFLWTIRNKDFDRFLQALQPEMAAKFRAVQQNAQLPSERFFQGVDAVVGLVILSRQIDSDDEISAQVAIAKDIPTQLITFRRIAGEWKMTWPEVSALVR